MSPGVITSLLADNGWGELVGTLVLVGFYVVAAIVKAISSRTAKAKQEAVESETEAPAPSKPRYKPLAEKGRPTQATQTKTLPYARTALQSSQTKSSAKPVLRPTGRLSEWDRQQELKRRRLEQIDALRRQQLAQSQQMHSKQSPPISPPAPARPAPAITPSAFQKSAQQALKQAKTGQPVQGKASVINPAVSQVRQAKATPKVVAQTVKAPLRSAPTTIPVSASADHLHVLLRKPSSIRTAMILKEILDSPLGLRNL